MTDLSDDEKIKILRNVVSKSTSSVFFKDIVEQNFIIENISSCLFCMSNNNLKYNIFNNIISVNCVCSYLCKISLQSMICSALNYNSAYFTLPYLLYHKDEFNSVKVEIEKLITDNNIKIFAELVDLKFKIYIKIINNYTIESEKLFILNVKTKSDICFYCGICEPIIDIKCISYKITGCCSMLCKIGLENQLLNSLKPVTYFKTLTLPFAILNLNSSAMQLFNKNKNKNNLFYNSTIYRNLLYINIFELIY